MMQMPETWTLILRLVLAGFLGGLIGGKLFKKVSLVWLKRLFALLVLYGAWTSLTG